MFVSDKGGSVRVRVLGRERERPARRDSRDPMRRRHGAKYDVAMDEYY